MPEPAIASTLDLRPHATFDSVSVLRPADEQPTLRNQLRLVWRILRAAAAGRPLVLYSSWGSLKPDLLALVLLGFLPADRRPPTVLVGEMWQPTPGRDRLERFVVRLADRAVGRYLVLSQAEADLLPQSWPVTADKVRVCPFYFAPHEHGLEPGDVPARGHYVFAGGDSFRDYQPLLEAAERMPDVSFLVVTKVLDGVPVPSNVQVRKAPYAEYVSLMRDADVVVVPVQRGLRRSAGILTFIMAMWLAKPTVVSDVLAVAEYIDDSRTGVLVDGSAAGYEAALRRLRDPENAAAVADMAQAARRCVIDTYSFDAYVRCILDELASLPSPWHV